MTHDPLADLSAQLGQLLKRKGVMLATAESCTGGWVGQAITAVSGSSEWFDRGFITYSNHAKHEMLGVSRDTLERFGAVSEETAREMAVGALFHSRAEVALAITGVAGPNGGSAWTPVGTVCFGWATRTHGSPPGTPHGAAFVAPHAASSTRKFRFEGDREAVRRQSVLTALHGMLEQVEKLPDAYGPPDPARHAS